MENRFKEKHTRILELLRSLPQPGRILLDSVGDGLSGLCLRPRSIPQKIVGENRVYSVDLQLIRDGHAFGNERCFKLDIFSAEWEQWVSSKPPLIIRADDIGKAIHVVEERERNFNRNLLHEFLDQFPIKLTIDQQDQNRMLDKDNYPFFFWDNPVCISGTARSSQKLSIKATVHGLNPAIKLEQTLHLTPWLFLPKEKTLFMTAVLKWHKALIGLYHLMQGGNVDIPVDLDRLEQTCRNEIDAASKPGIKEASPA